MDKAKDHQEEFESKKSHDVTKDDKKKKRKKKDTQEDRSSEENSKMSSTAEPNSNSSLPNSSRQDSRETKNTPAVVSGDVDPPGFYIGDEEKMKSMKAAKEEDSSTLSGAQKTKKQKKQKAESKNTEKDALIQSVLEVEERLKSREQFKLVVHKISLSKLVSAHRLLKNQPWLRAAYGRTVTWTLPSPQRLREDKQQGHSDAFVQVVSSCSGDGSAADWTKVDWSVNIERNESDRQDLVLAVCSRDVVLGRYVLARGDISELLAQQQAELESGEQPGMSLVEGEVVNDLGRAGKISLLCRVLPADKPQQQVPTITGSPHSRPISPVASSPSRTHAVAAAVVLPMEHFYGDNHIDNNNTNKNRNNIDNIDGRVVEDVEELALQQQQLLDAAGSEVWQDKKHLLYPSNAQTAHSLFLESQAAANRRFVTLRILGAAVMDLKKIHLFEANSPVLTVESGHWRTQTEARRQAGMAAKWTGLLWKVTVARDIGLLVTVTSLDKTVGRALLSMEELLNAPILQLTNPNNNSETQPVVQVRQVVKTLSSGSDYTGRVKLNLIVNHSDDVVDAMQLYTAYDTPSNINNTNSSMTGVTDTPTSHLPLTMQQGVSGRPGVFQPFQVMVREAVALDVSVPTWLRILRPGGRVSVTLHCAAGSWAQSTVSIMTDGRLAHWLSLQWAVPLLTETSSLRLTLWCGDVSVGAASLGPDELTALLLAQTPNIGTMAGGSHGEVLTQLRDAKGTVTAKLKLHCRYAALPVTSEGALLSRPQSSLLTTHNDNSSSNNNNVVNSGTSSNMMRPHSASSAANVLRLQSNTKDNNNNNSNSVGNRPSSALSPIPETHSPHNANNSNHYNSYFTGSDLAAGLRPASALGLGMGMGVSVSHSKTLNNNQNISNNGNHHSHHPFLAPTHFPLLITIVELALVDLLLPNNIMIGALPAFLSQPTCPVLQLLCDRQSLSTALLSEIDQSEMHTSDNSNNKRVSSMRWSHLPAKQWTLLVRADSSVSLAASLRRGSHVTPLGKNQLTPLNQLLGLPVDVDGFAQLIVPLKSREGGLAGRAILRMSVRHAPDANDNNFHNTNNGNMPWQDSLFQTSQLDKHQGHHVDQGVEADRARQRIEELQGRARAEVAQLRQEAQLMPTMPWNELQNDNNNFDNDDYDNHKNNVDDEYYRNNHNDNSNYNKQKQQVMLFDPRVLQQQGPYSASSGQVRICIDEVDLWELRKVHRLQRNDPRVAAASGKWTATTIAASHMRAKHLQQYYHGNNSDSLADGSVSVTSGVTDRCYWTKLDWQFTVSEAQQRLRLTVSSRGKVVGGAVFVVQDLLDLQPTDDMETNHHHHSKRGLRRITGELLGADDDFAGFIQLAFHLDILPPLNYNNHNSNHFDERTAQNTQQNRFVNQHNQNSPLPPMMSPSLYQDYNNSNSNNGFSNNSVPKHVAAERRLSSSSRGAQYIFGAEPSVFSQTTYTNHLNYNDHASNDNNKNSSFSRNHTMDAYEADEIERERRRPVYPCVLLLRDLAALDLLPLHHLPHNHHSILGKKKKQTQGSGRVCIEVYAENFFQTTEVDQLDTDFHTFLQLNWSVVVQENSVVRLVVRDIHKVEIGHCDLTPNQLWAVPQNSSGVREAMLVLQRDGLCSGKLIARAIFQPLSPLLLQPHSLLAHNSSSLQNNNSHSHSDSVQNQPQTQLQPYQQQQAPYQPYQQHQQQLNRLSHGHGQVVQAAGDGVIIDDHRYSYSEGSLSANHSISDIPPQAQQTISNNTNNRPRTMSGQQLQPGNLLEQSVVSDQLDNSAGGYSNQQDDHGHYNNNHNSMSPPVITYVVDQPGMGHNHGIQGGRPRLQSNGDASATSSLADRHLQHFYQQSNNNSNNINHNHNNHQQTNNKLSGQTVTTKDILAQPSLSVANNNTNITTAGLFPAVFQTPMSPEAQTMMLIHNSSNPQTPIAASGLSLPSLGASLILPDTLETPIRVVIRAVALIDLPRAHTFTANQPVCSLACSRFTAQLPMQSGQSDGQTAAWDLLNIAFAFEKGAQLRVHVTSKGTTIGICSLSRARMLSGRRSAQSGAFVIVDEILPPKHVNNSKNNSGLKAAGKLKLVYDLPDLAAPNN